MSAAMEMARRIDEDRKAKRKEARRRQASPTHTLDGALLAVIVPFLRELADALERMEDGGGTSTRQGAS